MSDDKEEKGGFDIFELMAAIVLGLGAIGGAWAGFQSGLWGGNQATAYADAANTMSEMAASVTEASTKTNDATMTGNRDADIDIQVKRLLVEDKGDVEAMKRHVYLAKYLYVSQLSDAAKKYLKLPMTDDPDEVTDDQLIAAATSGSLDEKYFDELYAESDAEYEHAETKAKQAKKVFYEGQQANYEGDKFALTGVLYTLCLFLSGIGLVFKSKVRWVFGALGVIALVGSTIHLFSNKSTSISAPEPMPADSAEPAASGAPKPAPSGAPASK